MDESIVIFKSSAYFWPFKYQFSYTEYFHKNGKIVQYQYIIINTTELQTKFITETKAQMVLLRISEFVESLFQFNFRLI